MIFENDKSSWSTKTNFVDKHNVVVGFDTGQDCCERADWFLAWNLPCRTDGSHINRKETDLGPFVFDTEYLNDSPSGDEDFDGGSATAFRLTDGEREMFLVLYNHQNGYYSHGFTFGNGDKTIRAGTV